jgi:Holliday junction resolvase RusA-like endonuclease
MVLATNDSWAFELLVHGQAKGKDRPRHGQGRTWTPAATVKAELEITRQWEEAGCPRVDGPLHLKVRVGVPRPKGHFTTKGQLSSKGQQMPYPSNKKPDLDNALKLVGDALNKKAWPDDVQVVRAEISREWADFAFTIIQCAVLAGPGLVEK